MTDRFLLQLADGWALGADDKQWMLLRSRKRHADTVWQPVAFIASTKIVLRRCMENNGVQLTADAQAWMDKLPERFLDFRSAKQNTAATRSAA